MKMRTDYNRRDTRNSKTVDKQFNKFYIKSILENFYQHGHVNNNIHLKKVHEHTSNLEFCFK